MSQAKRLDNKQPPVSNLQLRKADRMPIKRLRFISTVLQPYPEAVQKAPRRLAVDREAAFDIVREHKMKPILGEQLVAETEVIYAGLVMVEAKCIEVDNKQVDPASSPNLDNKQWQALIALHRILLYEHYEFFLTSQHPLASLELRRLASKYAMPARMWRHGIHSFLELLRRYLPASLDHMLAFIYFAYSMMGLLYETVPAFENTWIEYLGDLSRYRMLIEDDDIKDRDVWARVSRHWYSKASNISPGTGRLYHHLAILARPNLLLQLFYFTKSLCVAVPFSSTPESILVLSEPILEANSGQGQYRLTPFETSFVKIHSQLFTRNMNKFRSRVCEFLYLLYNRRATHKFLEQGYCIAISNIIAILGYGAQDNPLIIAIQDPPQDAYNSNTVSKIDEKAIYSQEALYLTTEVIKVVLKRAEDPNILPFIHVTLVFMSYISRYHQVMQYVGTSFPWQPLVETLNLLLAAYTTCDRIEDCAFPLPVKGNILAEDFALRGLTWVEGYYPLTWFLDDKQEEKRLEIASTADMRKERILWLACRIADNRSWLFYDKELRRFSTTFMEVPPL